MSRLPSAPPRRVVFLAENFAPGTAAFDFAVWLARRGLGVEAVAAEGTRRGDAAGWWGVEESRGVRIIRCPRRRAAAAQGLGHQLQHVSFALSSAPILLDRARHFRPQLMAAFDPPPACLPALLLAARRAHARSWLHLAEDAAPGTTALRRFGHVSLAAIDAEARLAHWGVGERRRLALPPWVDNRALFPLPEPSPLRARLGLPEDAIVALYAGSLDDRRSIALLAEAAHLMPRNGAVIFVVAGRGAAWSTLQTAGRTAPLHLLPWPRGQDLNGLLNLADIHLAPAGLATPDRLFPSKPAALLASGRPILAAGQAADVPTHLASAVRALPAAAQAWAAAIVELSAAPRERERRGAAARQAALDYHDKERVFRHIEGMLGLAAPPGAMAS